MSGPYGPPPPQGPRPPYGPHPGPPPGRPPYGPSPHPGYGPYGPQRPPQGPYGQPAYGMPPGGYRPAPPPVRFSEGTHRLHWATAPLRALVILIIYFVLLGFPLLLTQTDQGVALVLSPEVVVRFTVVTAVIGVIAVAAGLWGWLALRFRVDGDDLVVETGLLRKRKRRIPLSRVQAIDLVRPLVTRMFALAEVRVELAGGEASGIVLRYLGRHTAQQLRAELLARAAGLPGHTPEAPERPLWKVPFGALLGSLVLKLPVIGTALAFLASLFFLLLFVEGGMLVVLILLLLGLIRAVIAPMVMYVNHSVAMSPDGVRLRYGLLETRMQTLPPGRVQAVGLVEPLLWRPFGWARLDVTVAGYAGERQALSSVLLPLAPRPVAVHLISQIFPGANVDAVPLLPASSRSVALERADGAGTDDHVFVTRRGWLCRRTDVIAHARAQSVRMTVNPLQRMLRLATVRVDAPPGPVQVAAADRELGEARAIVESTAYRALAARRTSKDPGRWAR
ncbi:PH domain-containing protein [Spirillospora sp. NPDC029432]|uniref:PH domain-containing protein n=1 Tax=Spirillospora sp. NPDC029432 TaxID=3154599 RepID=UPI003456C41E